ncbi:MAG: hypothetical protein ACFFBP_23295 [Promethearchaeota archaeon]
MSGDFTAFYEAGKKVLSDPENLYEWETADPYLYLPSLAISFSITLSLLPYLPAYFIFYIINYIAGILSILEFNKILKMMNVKKEMHRLIFLFIIANGYLVYIQFYFNQFKYLLFIIFLVIIRREIQFRLEEREKNHRYYLINYTLFVYAIGLAPYFIFTLFIYIFNDIKFQDLIEKENLKKYCILIVLFLLENFLFLIYPNLIFEFLKGFTRPGEERVKIKMLYLKGLIDVSASRMEKITYISIAILTALTILLILVKNLKIEEKFSYFFLAYLFVGVFSYPILLGLMLFSFTLLLFVPFLNQKARGKEFIKENKFLLIGLLSIATMFFITDDFILYQFFPGYFELELGIIDKSKMFILHIIMMICLGTLYIQKYKTSKLEKERKFRIINTKEITY